MEQHGSCQKVPWLAFSMPVQSNLNLSQVPLMRIAIYSLTLSFLVLSNAARSAPAIDPESGAEYVTGEVVVQFEPGASDAEVLDAVQRSGMVFKRSVRGRRQGRSGVDPAVYVARVPRSAGQVTRMLRNHPGVRSAEPNWIYHATTIPSEAGGLWGMGGGFGANAVGAWSAGYTGGQTVVVGILDDGIDVDHLDLAPNIWTNPDPQAPDVHGWDFFHDDATVFDGGDADGCADSHGTHVAGTIGAVGDGRGVVGVCYGTVQLVSAKFLGPNGGYLSDAIAAIDYLTGLKRKGVNIVAINASWGGGGYSAALLNSITAAANEGILFVAAAGNGDSRGRPINVDRSLYYPACYDTTAGAGFDAVIAVTAIDVNGSRASWANYGLRNVDLGAPGVSIWSDYQGNYIAQWSGTSMATPHVTGALALFLSHNAVGAADARATLLATTTPTSSIASTTVTGGRLDVDKLLAAGVPPGPPVNNPPVATDDSAETLQGEPVQIQVIANDSDELKIGLIIGITVPPQNGSVQVESDQTVTYTPDPFFSGQDTFAYSITDNLGQVAWATVTMTVVLNAPPVASNDAVSTLAGDSVVVDILGNDTDERSNSLTVSVSSFPQHGTAEVGADGRITYTPAVGYVGEDSFEYTLTDNLGQTASARVSIMVDPQPSVIPLYVDVSGVSQSYSRRRTTATVSVTVRENDAFGAIVPAANVSGLWSIDGSPAATTTGTSNSAGTVTFQIRFRGRGAVSFDVTGVTKDGYVF